MVSLAILYSIQFTIGLRVSELDEKLGLDITTHGEVIDNPEELIGSKKHSLEIISRDLPNDSIDISEEIKNS